MSQSILYGCPGFDPQPYSMGCMGFLFGCPEPVPGLCYEVAVSFSLYFGGFLVPQFTGKSEATGNRNVFMSLHGLPKATNHGRHLICSSAPSIPIRFAPKKRDKWCFVVLYPMVIFFMVFDPQIQGHTHRRYLWPGKYLLLVEKKNITSDLNLLPPMSDFPGDASCLTIQDV